MIYVVEAAGFSALLSIFNYFYYPLSVYFIGDSLNLYQLLALFMSIRYGSSKGLFSFFIIFSAGAVTPVLRGFSYKLYENDTLYFLFAAFVLSRIAGILRDYHNSEIENLTSKFQKLSDEYSRCKDGNILLSNANQNLTKKVVTKFYSFSSIYELAQKFETLDVTALYSAIAESLKNHIKVKKAFIYEVQKNMLVMKAFFGTAGEVVTEKVSLINDHMFYEAFQKKSTVTLFQNNYNITSTADLKTAVANNEKKHLIVEPVMVNREVKCLIVIDEIDFENYNDTCVRMVNLIAKWASGALNNIEKVSTIENSSFIDHDINCFKPNYIKHALEAEMGKAIRYKLPLTVCSVKIEKLDAISDKTKKLVFLTLGYIISNVIRSIDIYGAATETGTFIIILPVTKLEGANIVVSRLIKQIDELKIMPYQYNDEPLSVSHLTFSLYDHILSENSVKTMGYESIAEESRKAYDFILEKISF
ncbi:MAG: hypothetical protein QMC67_13410 [Candidatus Wallbacteria bacterium]